MRLLNSFKDVLRPYVTRNRVASAFKTVFNPKGELFEDQRIVLKELNTFCYIRATHHGDSATAMARVAGRREVYNWIVGMTDYDAFDLEQLMRQMGEYDDE